MQKYASLSVIRDQYVEGVGPWHWPVEDTGAWGATSDGPSYEFPLIRDVILRCVKKQDLIVQAGGCCGMYPRLFSDHFAQVWTFEPCPYNFYHLALNCQKDNIFKFQAALSDRHGLTGLVRCDQKNVGMHHLAWSEDRPMLPVPTMTIDSLNLPACDAIQLDVEGSEEFALGGAVNTVEKFRPVIAVETVSGWTKEFFEKNKYERVTNIVVDTIWRPL